MTRIIFLTTFLTLFSAASFAEKMRVCVPIKQDTTVPAEGLRSVGGTIDYAALCKNPGYTCINTKNGPFDMPTSRCFYITSKHGKIPTEIEQKMEHGHIDAFKIGPK